MHELPLVKSIYKTVLRFAEKNGAARVTRVVLEIGAVRDFIPEIVQKYWDYVSRGSIGEGALIEIVTVPATVRCGRCGAVRPIEPQDFEGSRCPNCRFRKGTLVSGQELNIKGVEIER